MPDIPPRQTFISSAVVKAFESLGKVRINQSAVYEPESMIKLLADCHIAVTGWGACPPLDESLLKGAKNLGLVAHTGGSVGDLATDYLYDRGIRVISGNELYAESVAEGTLAYILTALRRILFFDKKVQENQWFVGMDRRNKGLFDRHVGLVGFGAIPRHLIGMLKPFRVKIWVYDPFVSDDDLQSYGIERAPSLEAIFSECDIVSNHLPLKQETHHLVNADLLSKMRPGSLFVNTGRGSTVDENALEDILLKGEISAAIDVFEMEPLPADSRLRSLDNVLLIPHMGGPTMDRHEPIGLAMAADCKNFLEGKPLTYEITKEYAAKMSKLSMVKYKRTGL